MQAVTTRHTPEQARRITELRKGKRTIASRRLRAFGDHDIKNGADTPSASALDQNKLIALNYVPG